MKYGGYAECNGWNGHYSCKNDNRARQSADGYGSSDDNTTETCERDVHCPDQPKTDAAFGFRQFVNNP